MNHGTIHQQNKGAIIAISDHTVSSLAISLVYIHTTVEPFFTCN